MKKIIILICFLFVFCSCERQTRDGIIIEVPIEAFNEKGDLTDNDWKNYLQKRKPVGIIFFANHFQEKEVAKNIIRNIQKEIGEKVILSADEEGGRVNRIDWVDVPSSEEIAEKYLQIKKTKGKELSKLFVREQYAPMFREMKEIGLNMTFAPNLDLNKYASLKKGTNEYANYKKCVKYVKLTRTNIKKISKKDESDYNKSLLFLAFLEENNIRKMNIIGSNYKLNEIVRQRWRNLKLDKKNNLVKEFEKLKTYANYAFVIGDRSFGNDPEIVGEIAEIFVDTAKEFGIGCVMKHALGHGRVDGDTHIDKQILNISKEELLNDIKPYITLKDKVKFVMPSHIIYSSIDNENTAINSIKVLNFIRKYVNKDVKFITDDISMEGANNSVKSPCDLWIVSHKPLDVISKIGVKNQISKSKADNILSSLNN